MPKSETGTCYVSIYKYFSYIILIYVSTSVFFKWYIYYYKKIVMPICQFVDTSVLFLSPSSTLGVFVVGHYFLGDEGREKNDQSRVRYPRNFFLASITLELFVRVSSRSRRKPFGFSPTLETTFCFPSNRPSLYNVQLCIQAISTVSY